MESGHYFPFGHFQKSKIRCPHSRQSQVFAQYAPCLRCIIVIVKQDLITTNKSLASYAEKKDAVSS